MKSKLTSAFIALCVSLSGQALALTPITESFDGTTLDPAPYRALRRPAGARHVEAIDQRALPHAVVTARIADAA